MPQTLENLQWRNATKKYDAASKLSDDQRTIISEALRLSPSSMGLQPWKFIHVASPETRERLKVAAWNQPQLTEASDIFVLCSLTGMDEKYIDAFLKVTADQRHVTLESLAGFRAMLMKSIEGKTAEELREWNRRQVYIALGFALAVAAENHIDATPMEGFDAKQFDEILGLEKLGLQACVILAVGFRSADDGYANLSKVRFDRKEVILEM